MENGHKDEMGWQPRAWFRVDNAPDLTLPTIYCWGMPTSLLVKSGFASTCLLGEQNLELRPSYQHRGSWIGPEVPKEYDKYKNRNS